MTDDVGARLRNVRKRKGLTLTELAKHAGLSASYISNLERNACSPTLDNLQKICAALRISLIKLLEEKPGSDYVSRAGQHEIVFEKKGQIRYESINYGEERLSGLIITIEPHCNYKKEWTHEYEEIGLVLEGKLTLTMNDEEYLLEKGDSFYIDAQVLHSISNNTEERCISYWVKKEI